MLDLDQVREEISGHNISYLDFEPVKKSHILHCSYDYWHTKYRSSALKSTIIPLPLPFLEYLRSDGIILSSDSHVISSSPYDSDFSNFADSRLDDSQSSSPSVAFPELHQKIKDSIAELGGLVAPKLNWSAPKDATWISMKKNSMECATPDDIYLLLKSSDFITFDLEHPFDDTVEDESIGPEDINYVLVLRKWFLVNPSFEFRCFVRNRKIIAISQRDINHFDFLFSLKEKLRDAITSFFNKILKETFPDANFVFDVYLPDPFERVRLMDINAWAPRTDPLLFSWQELLSQPQTKQLRERSESYSQNQKSESLSNFETESREKANYTSMPEFRLVKKTDTQAFNFASSQYSAYKVPREVLQAGLLGETGIKDFSTQWKMMLNGQAEMQTGLSSDDDSD